MGISETIPLRRQRRVRLDIMYRDLLHAGTMRYYCSLILAASALLSSGCSLLIARSGTDLYKLSTREQVHEKFGDPCTTGTIEGQPFEGQQFETFLTRQKISEDYFVTAHHCMEIAMTYGLLEFIAFPHELYLLGRRSLFGQNIRFTYDATGNVTSANQEDDKSRSRSSLESPVPMEHQPPPTSRAKDASLP
jgi:YD repeat-containing protein